MSNKWQLPVYIVVAALVAFLIWQFVRPPQPVQNTDNTAQDSKDKDKGKSNSPENRRPPFNPLDFQVSTDGFASTQPTPPPPLDPKKPLTRTVVSGRVLESQDGGGVKDAKVSFVGAGDLKIFIGSGYTQPDGSYRFLIWQSSTPPANPSGKSRGRVHVAAPDGRGILGEEIDLDASLPIQLPDIIVRSLATISGRVVGPDNMPARGVRVDIRSATVMHTLEETRTAFTIQTGPHYRHTEADDGGYFEFKGLEPATYKLSVDSNYYGKSDFVFVDASRGGSVWQDLKLVRENWVRGTVKDPQGRPVPGVIVRLEWPPVADTQSEDDEPEVVVQPPPKKPGGPKERPERPKTPEERKKMREEREKEREARKKSSSDPFKKRPDRPTPEKQPPKERPVHSVKTVTDELGQFGFTDLEEDKPYRIQTMVGGERTEVLGARVNMSDYSLEVAFSNRVAGRVLDAESGKPITRYDIKDVGLGTGGREAELRATPFDRITNAMSLMFHSEGRFAMFNLDRGARLRVCAPGYVMRALDVTDLKRGDDRQDLEIKLDPLCNLSLTLRQDGVVLPLEPVMVFFNAGLAFLASTDEMGQVRLAGVMPGDYTIQVQRADGTMLGGKVTVPAKSRATLEASLELK